jgi:hypothetical protein
MAYLTKKAEEERSETWAHPEKRSKKCERDGSIRKNGQRSMVNLNGPDSGLRDT